MKTVKLNSIFLTGIISLLLFSQNIYAQSTWLQRGSDPAKYEMGIDKGFTLHGKSVMTIKSIDNDISGFGTYMQNIIPGKYKGKRIKVSGYVKTQAVSDWAGLWVRVDQAEPRKMLAFDNMDERPIKGTTDWTRYEIVVDVPETASQIAFGALLGGSGQIWFDEMVMEIVSNTTPTTGNKQID